MDFIKDRDHQHMNSTIWATLGNFVEYLIRTNQVLGERDSMGRWLITYIDRERDKRDAEKAKEELKKLSAAEKEERQLQKLINMKPMEDYDFYFFLKKFISTYFPWLCSNAIKLNSLNIDWINKLSHLSSSVHDLSVSPNIGISP